MSSGPDREKRGEHFGAYELVRRLGRGGMAETFEAIRCGHGDVQQRVCLKRILPPLEGDSEFLELFLRESKISATLTHTNVAQVLDFGDVDGRHYLVLELVDGVDLRTLLRGLLETGDTLDGNILGYLAVELAQALDYAHAATTGGVIRGVVHRDISPSNVLLAASGEVKLADFGVAKAMNSPSLTQTGGAKGKIPYMAPEYARSGICDARSDLFSLGVVLYECAAGRRPFDGANDVETMERIQQGAHVSLTDLARSDVAPALAASIESMICHDPDARPANAGALLERLQAAQPRPSARLALGRMVAGRRDALASEVKPLGLLATARATPGGTLVVGDAAPAPWVVDSAPADAVTRTRSPAAHAPRAVARSSRGIRAEPREAGEETRGVAPGRRRGGSAETRHSAKQSSARMGTAPTPAIDSKAAAARVLGGRTIRFGLLLALGLLALAWLLRAYVS